MTSLRSVTGVPIQLCVKFWEYMRHKAMRYLCIKGCSWLSLLQSGLDSFLPCQQGHHLICVHLLVCLKGFHTIQVILLQPDQQPTVVTQMK